MPTSCARAPACACPSAERVQDFLRRHPDEFYLGGIEILTLLIVIAIMTPVYNSFQHASWAASSRILVLLLPCSQSAVEVMNYLTTALLHPRILPKLDFSEGIPDDCVTMVVVPTLLLNEKQVRRLVEDLEVRYLGNTEPQPAFCAADRLARLRRDAQRRRSAGRSVLRSLIDELNDKYAAEGVRHLRALPSPSRSTTRAKASGWAGSASAASCSTSTG